MEKDKVWFCLEDPTNTDAAHAWHLEFARQDPNILLREINDFKSLAEEGRVIVAKNSAQSYIGLVYFDFEPPCWIVGGLMVDPSHRKRGIGEVLTHLALGHILIYEDPVSRNESILAYVVATNQKPMALMQSLAFQPTGLTRARTLNLNSLGETTEIISNEYKMIVPDTVIALAKWCSSWKGILLDNSPAEAALKQGVTLANWSATLYSMAEI